LLLKNKILFIYPRKRYLNLNDKTSDPSVSISQRDGNDEHILPSILVKKSSFLPTTFKQSTKSIDNENKTAASSTKFVTIYYLIKNI